jgi:hypothetical protein
VPRFFTLLEAEVQLPQIERFLRTLIQLKQEYDEAGAQTDRIAQQIAISGGMIAPREQLLQLRSQKEQSVKGLNATVAKMQDIGCHLKDLEKGLIDFPTLYRDREVYLCWKLGESGISFWHSVEDGFAGRRPIDSDFLSNHRGDPAH